MNYLTEIKLLIGLNKIWSEEKGLMRLKLSTSTIIQVLAGAVQALNLIVPTTSGNAKMIISVAVGVIQVGINTISHLSNPDGTDARVASGPAK